MPFSYKDYLMKNPGKHVQVYAGTIVGVDMDKKTININTHRPPPQRSRYTLQADNYDGKQLKDLKAGDKCMFWVREAIKEVTEYSTEHLTTDDAGKGKWNPAAYRELKKAGLNSMTIHFHTGDEYGNIIEWAVKHKCGDGIPIPAYINQNNVVVKNIPIKPLYVKHIEKETHLVLVSIE